MKRAILFMAWGEVWLKEVATCLRKSSNISDYDIFLITDKGGMREFSKHKGDLEAIKQPNLIQTNFVFPNGFLRKTELMDYVPSGYNSFCFLDSDTRVVGDIGLGFEKAERHGLALAQAPQYSLDHFQGFDQVMLRENVPLLGQTQYNTGVIFFRDSPDIRKLMAHWRMLAQRYTDIFPNDQPLFSLALEQMGIIPYTLSIGYNYRGFGEGICGLVRIWHSHGKMPDRINEFLPEWPLRRASPGRIIYPISETVLDYVDGTIGHRPDR